MQNKECRSFNFEVRAEENEQHGTFITGTPIVFDQATDMGWYAERISRDALNGCDLKDVRFLVGHNTSMIPLARSRNNNENSTMQMTVDDNGMNIRVDLDTENNTEARALYSAVERGDISGMSFMFGVRDEEWDNLESEHPTRRIKAISTVVEVSAVTFPAYNSTTINARSKEALDNARSALESARQQTAAAVDTDESKKTLELLKEKTKLLGGLRK